MAMESQMPQADRAHVMRVWRGKLRRMRAKTEGASGQVAIGYQARQACGDPSREVFFWPMRSVYKDCGGFAGGGAALVRMQCT